MKLAVFTPLHPVRCGVSGYSEALLPALRQHLEIEVFAGDYEAEALPGRAAIFGKTKGLNVFMDPFKLSGRTAAIL